MNANQIDQCAVCKLRDARALSVVALAEERVILCGSHALMQQRCAAHARTAGELCKLLGDRRKRTRRIEEPDELAAQLTAAFAADRRGVERRAR